MIEIIEVMRIVIAAFFFIKALTQKEVLASTWYLAQIRLACISEKAVKFMSVLITK